MSKHQKKAKVRNFPPFKVAQKSEVESHDYFAKQRWDGLPVCPYCGAEDNHYLRKDRLQYMCKHCCRTFSVTSATMLEHHKLGYTPMLTMLAQFATSSDGIASQELSKKMGVTPKTCLIFGGKIREALVEGRDLSPLREVVHIDGAAFGGMPRRANKRRQNINGQMVIDRYTRKQLTYAEPRNASNQAKFDANRRCVFVARQVDPQKGVGAVRTIVGIAKKEHRDYAVPFAKAFVDRKAEIWSDEGVAFQPFARHWKHRTVKHKDNYRGKDGTHNNHAESFFGRFRRAQYGTFHRVTAKYMMDYANEFAWREDNRRNDTESMVKDLLKKLLTQGRSKWWRGYCRKGYRRDELLMYKVKK